MLEVAADPRINGGLLKRRDVARQFKLDLRRRSLGMDDAHRGDQVLERVALQFRARAGAGHNSDRGQNGQDRSQCPPTGTTGSGPPDRGAAWMAGAPNSAPCGAARSGRSDAGFCFRLLHKFQVVLRGFSVGGGRLVRHRSGFGSCKKPPGQKRASRRSQTTARRSPPGPGAHSARRLRPGPAPSAPCR